MATSIRIIGVPVRNKLEVWVVDHVYWWPVEDFLAKPAQEKNAPVFRESVDSSMYLDTVGLFNAEEFVRLNDECKAAFLADAEKKSLHADQKARMREVDDYLEKRSDTKWVLVEQYEWETGMN